MAARIGRPVRFLGKQELFDAPVVGQLARALGGIPVDRGSGSGGPMREATARSRAGEVVIILPQGTIPRGEAFFDPVLQGKTGAARLAAATGRPGRPHRPVGDREGVAPVVQGAQRDQPHAPAAGDASPSGPRCGSV